MAIPSTGTDFSGGGYNDVDNRFYQRGGVVAALVRDYRGAATNMSPADFGGPFAEDSSLRDDMFAVRKENGFWVTVTDPNEGWWLIGAMSEDGGPERKPSIDSDDAMILQSNYPFDTDITKQDKTVSFTAVESAKPLIHRLKMNKPLSDPDGNILVEDPGTKNYFQGTPVEADFVERQLILIRARSKAGKKIYTAEGYPLVKLTDIGAAKMSKKDPDAAELTFKVLPDPFFVDLDGTPILEGLWMAGDGWTALGGVPVVSSAPTGATATTTGKATLTTPDPTGAGDPFSITAESTIDDGVNWLPATLDTPGAVTSNGTLTTVKVKSVAAGSTKFRLKVEGTNGAVAYTTKSAAVTIT